MPGSNKSGHLDFNVGKILGHHTWSLAACMTEYLSTTGPQLLDIIVRTGDGTRHLSFHLCSTNHLLLGAGFLDFSDLLAPLP